MASTLTMVALSLGALVASPARAAGVLAVPSDPAAQRTLVHGLAPTVSGPAGVPVLAAPRRSVPQAPQPQPSATFQNPVLAQAFPDPSAVKTGTDYYAYATGDRFPVLHSTDLVHWERLGTAFVSAPAWLGDHFWAPSPLAAARPRPGSTSPGCYYLYYVGRKSVSPETHCVGVAYATRPAGPFQDLGILSSGAPRPSYRDAVLRTPGLAGYWRLSDTTGSRAAGLVGGHDGTYVGRAGLGFPGALSDDADTAVAFDGQSSVRIPRLVSDDFSLEFWFSSKGGGIGSERRQWWQGAGLVDGKLPGVGEDFGTSLDAAGRVWAGVGHPDVSIHSGPGYDDGAWHHVVFTRQRASGALALYVDGRKLGAGTGGTQRLENSPSLRVGALGPGTHGLRGALDDVAVYTAALSPAQVQAHFDRPAIGCGDSEAASLIDPAPFVDVDGRAYLYVATERDRSLSVIPLADDLIHASGPRAKLVVPTENWETASWGPVVEGPYAIRRNTIAAAGAPYYLFYSGGGWPDDYGMGYATAPSPSGPFTKAPANPILASVSGVVGPGGGSVVTGPLIGADYMLYHAHLARGGPRVLFLDRIVWKDPEVAVAGPTLTPQPLP